MEIITNLIGRKVRVLSISADNFFRRLDTTEDYHVKRVSVEINNDGTFYPVVELEEVNGYFLPKDLQLV